MTECPKDVPYDETPEPTIHNVPDDTIEAILATSAKYGECPYCETRQWYKLILDHYTTWDCIECGETMEIVG